ncbi:MFS transporter [Streptomyces sp. NPDC101455]|uniref:MFS transporter n=1 Tax=Streptomyces sp. NPDC101455 TaxID=3366142 RepID=UPI0037FFADA2
MTISAPAAVRDQQSPAASRRLLIGIFALVGIVMATWGARMPAVRDSAHLGSGGLAIVLMAAAVGLVAGLQVGGRVAHRYGSSRLLAVPAVGFGLSLAVLGQCRSLATLSLAAAALGAGHGLLDVGANASAVNCQRAYGRPIMAGLHACYSLGALAGAAVASVSTSLSHGALFAVVGASTALAGAASLPAVRAASHLDAASSDDASAPAAREADKPVNDAAQTASRRVLWLLGALAAACLLCEGAAADWSAIHLRELGGSESVAAAAYAVYSAAMAAGRLCGDRLIARFTPSGVVRAGAAIAAIGLGCGVIADSVPMALIGWAALGVGLSTVVPSLITAAGSGGPRAVGMVATTGYLGLLAGPAAIGALASWSSLPVALLLPVVLAVVVATASRQALEPR